MTPARKRVASLVWSETRCRLQTASTGQAAIALSQKFRAWYILRLVYGNAGSTPSLLSRDDLRGCRLLAAVLCEPDLFRCGRVVSGVDEVP